MITFFDSYKWLTSPTAYITLKYEYKREGTSLHYRFNYKVWLGSAFSYYNDGLRISFSYNELVVSATVKEYGTDRGWSKEGMTDWMVVPNKTSGGTIPIIVRLVDTNTNETKFVNSFRLDAPAMPSQITNDGQFDVDGSIAVLITKYDKTIADTLTIALGDTIIKTIVNITSSIGFSFSASEKAVIYNLMTALNSASFTFTLSSSLGTTTITRSGVITNASPTISATGIAFKDTNNAVVAITGNNQVIVQNKSTVALDIPTASAKKGATIAKYSVVIGEDTYESATSGNGKEFGKITTSGSLNIVITVTDSRGNTATASKAINVIEYSAPTFTATVHRKNNYEAETTFKVDANYSTVNGLNALKIKYNYAKVGEVYSNNIPVENGIEYILNCDQRYAYTFAVTVLDTFGTSVAKIFYLSKGKLPLFIDIEKNAVGINAFPLAGEALRVGEGVAVFEDGIVLQSSTEGSTKLFKITVNDSGTLTATEYK